MRALTVVPGTANSARLDDVAEPPPGDGSVLVQTLSVGVCGTDIDIISGSYGWPPPGRDRLILGHESLGRVVEAPAASGLNKGDLVVGIVRRPDPVPCPNCAVDEWDMCRNGLYTERGIKERDGFCSERYRIHPKYAVKVDPRLERRGVLLEPASVVAKAWDEIERIGSRALWKPERVLVTGAGPIGLLAALMGVQRGLEVHVLDRVKEGPKPALVKELGARYHTGSVKDTGATYDVVVECTGVGALIFEVIQQIAPGGIVCLAGISSGGHKIEIDLDSVNRSMVLENAVIFGSVNANRRHYELGAAALAKADQGWLDRVLSRRAPLERWQEALERQPNDVKTVIDVSAS